MKKYLFIIFTLLFFNLQAFAEQNNAKDENTSQNESIQENQEPSLLERLEKINAKKLRVYGFNPVKNPNNQITIVEFNDLSCSECMAETKKIYNQITDENKQYLRIIYKHIQENEVQLINNHALYGLLASDNLKFWEFKDALNEKTYEKDEDIIDLLISFGLDKKQLAKDLLNNSARYYSNLDADSYYAHNLRSSNVPMMYIDGYRLGEEIQYSELNEYIQARSKQIKQAKELEDNRYKMGRF